MPLLSPYANGSTKENLVTQMADYVRKNCPQLSATSLKVSLVNPNQLDVIKEGTPLKLQIQESDTQCAGRVYVWGVSEPDTAKSVPQKIALVFEIKGTQMVPVAKHRVLSNQVITSADIDMVELDSDRLSEKSKTSQSEIVGKQATSVIEKGSVFVESRLRELPLVRKREPVMVLIAGNGVMLKMTGTAEEDGYLHSVIPVQTQYNKRIKGEVVGAKTVKTQFTY